MDTTSLVAPDRFLVTDPDLFSGLCDMAGNMQGLFRLRFDYRLVEHVDCAQLVERLRQILSAQNGQTPLVRVIAPGMTPPLHAALQTIKREIVGREVAVRTHLLDHSPFAAVDSLSAPEDAVRRRWMQAGMRGSTMVAGTAKFQRDYEEAFTDWLAALDAAGQLQDLVDAALEEEAMDPVAHAGRKINVAWQALRAQCGQWWQAGWRIAAAAWRSPGLLGQAGASATGALRSRPLVFAVGILLFTAYFMFLQLAPTPLPPTEARRGTLIVSEQPIADCRRLEASLRALGLPKEQVDVQLGYGEPESCVLEISDLDSTELQEAVVRALQQAGIPAEPQTRYVFTIVKGK
jgi:hypothetical protein